MQKDQQKDYEKIKGEYVDYSQLPPMSEDDVNEFRRCFEYECWPGKPFQEEYNACKHSTIDVPVCFGNDSSVHVLVHKPPEVKAYYNHALVVFHKGSAIAGSAELDQAFFSKLAVVSKAIVFNVDYRLAPEVNATQQAMDGVAVIKHLWDNADKLSLERTKIAIFGAEGGGHVVMSVCGMLASLK